MPITNRHNLPEAVVSALTKNRYSGADKDFDYSVTQLIAPIQQTLLKKRHPDSETNDVIDNLWSMFGSIAHTLLEEHGGEHAEQRLYTKICGLTISGGIDYSKDGTITDYKVTSVWKIQSKKFKEWEQQLNCYKYLIEHTQQICIDKLQIVCILRDWNAPEGYKENYPEAPIQIIDIPVWHDSDCHKYLVDRCVQLVQYSHFSDEKLPECTPEEMWCTPSKWAIYKTLESKRATRVFDTEQEAIDSGIEGIIIERKGERRRCERYCGVSSVCKQFEAYKKESF